MWGISSHARCAPRSLRWAKLGINGSREHHRATFRRQQAQADSPSWQAHTRTFPPTSKLQHHVRVATKWNNTHIDKCLFVPIKNIDSLSSSPATYQATPAQGHKLSGCVEVFYFLLLLEQWLQSVSVTIGNLMNRNNWPMHSPPMQQNSPQRPTKPALMPHSPLNPHLHSVNVKQSELGCWCRIVKLSISLHSALHIQRCPPLSC